MYQLWNLLSVLFFTACLSSESGEETMDRSSSFNLQSSSSLKPRFDINRTCLRDDSVGLFLYQNMDASKITEYKTIMRDEYFLYSEVVLLGEYWDWVCDSNGVAIDRAWFYLGDTLWVESKLEADGSLSQSFHSTDSNFNFSTLLNKIPEKIILDKPYYMVYDDLCYYNWGFEISKISNECINVMYSNFNSSCRDCPNAIFCKGKGLQKYEDGFDRVYTASKKYSRVEE